MFIPFKLERDKKFHFKTDNIEVFYNQDVGRYELVHSGEVWMSYVSGDPNASTQNRATIYIQFSSYDLAYGDVVTSGLGFGLIQNLILNKPNVKSLTVYEISKDVIELNRELYGDEFLDKMTIINDSINNAKNIKCDCLILDHYDPIIGIEKFHDGTPDRGDLFSKRIIKDIKDISLKNPKVKLLWFWDIENSIMTWQDPKKHPNDAVETWYKEWCDETGILNLPKLNKEKLTMYFDNMTNIHINHYNPEITKYFMYPELYK